MKKPLPFLLAITMLSLCGFLGFFGFILWEGERDRKEKRSNLDRYYTREIESWFLSHYDILDGRSSGDGYKDSNDSIKKTEANMLKEGYDRAEIQQITFTAMSLADNRRKLLKQSEEAYAKEIERADREARKSREEAIKPTK